MPQGDIPILVVDDAKFSSAIIAKALRAGGFNNVRFTNNPLQALRSLEKRPAAVVISDWLMPVMDGIELVRRIKKLDEAAHRYTYTMLLTTRDDVEALEESFRSGVDDFLNKANLRTQLLPRVVAAHRIARRQNELLGANQQLRRKLRDTQTTDLVDPTTGLGNVRYTLNKLGDVLKHAETRGGSACVILVGIQNLAIVQQQFEPTVVDELMSALGSRLRQLVRPLDTVTRPEPDLFAILLTQPAPAGRGEVFRRIFDSLYMRSFKTSRGFIPIVIGMSICSADASTGFPGPKLLMELASKGIVPLFDSGTISSRAFDPVDAI
ncbi:MAG: response regulator [Gammaproteobacteria bacterium]|nr:response regulator [Gammaproteobacteria bacterium]